MKDVIDMVAVKNWVLKKALELYRTSENHPWENAYRITRKEAIEEAWGWARKEFGKVYMVALFLNYDMTIKERGDFVYSKATQAEVARKIEVPLDDFHEIRIFCQHPRVDLRRQHPLFSIEEITRKFGCGHYVVSMKPGEIKVVEVNRRATV